MCPCFCLKVYEWIKNQSNKAVFSRETLVHDWDSGKITRLSPFSLCTVIWMITSHIDKTIWNSLIVLCHFFRESNARSQVRSTFYKNYLHWLITTCILKLTKSYWSFYVWPNWIELNALRTWGNKPRNMPTSGHNPITTMFQMTITHLAE